MGRFTHEVQKYGRSVVRRCVAGGLLSAALSAPAAAQGTAAQNAPPPVRRVTMEEAVRLAIARNQALQAQRLEIDAAKADETTAALKPNPSFSFDADGFTP